MRTLLTIWLLFAPVLGAQGMCCGMDIVVCDGVSQPMSDCSSEGSHEAHDQDIPSHRDSGSDHEQTGCSMVLCMAQGIEIHQGEAIIAGPGVSLGHEIDTIRPMRLVSPMLEPPRDR